MKKHTLLLAFLTGFSFSIISSGCSAKMTEQCTQLQKASDQLEANLKMYTSVWEEILNNGKIEMINESHFDKNVTLVMSPENDNIVGVDNFRAYYNNFLTGFSDIEFTVIDAFGQGDKIVKHWNFKGKNTGDFFWLDPTNKEVDIDGVTLVLMKDGKILQEQDFMDNLLFMQQLGFIPEE